MQGEVIAVGPGARDEQGKVVPLDIKAGDRVLFAKWGGTEVKIDGEDGDGSVIVGKILENPKYGYGYNAQTLVYGDLIAEGVIDPAKVVRSALQGAASVAGLLVTTEAMVAELPKKESAHPPMPGGGMGGMDF
jgi:hypothetical protein